MSRYTKPRGNRMRRFSTIQDQTGVEATAEGVLLTRRTPKSNHDLLDGIGSKTLFLSLTDLSIEYELYAFKHSTYHP
jgi:hypothetical protein